MASKLYLARKAATKLPKPDKKKGLVVTADGLPGATSLTVDDSSGYVAGDMLGTISYVNPVPVSGQYEAATVNVFIATIASPTSVTLQTALPSPYGGGAVIKAGAKFGFEGTLAEWTAQVTPQLIKILTPMADLANGDALAICTAQVNPVTSSETLDLLDDIALVGTRGGVISVQAPSGANVGWACDVIEVAGSATQINLTAPGGETIQGATTITSAFGKRTIRKTGATTWAAYA